MIRYAGQTRLLVAVNCIVFGFDRNCLKILLIHNGFEPKAKKWSLMGGFVCPNENLDRAASRILKQLTGLEAVYLEQMQAFGDPKRNPVERTITIVYFALIDICRYKKQISNESHTEWFPLSQVPVLIFDHAEIIERAKRELRYKASIHPILFELLPEKFTLPQLLNLYDTIYGANYDKRNFTRKLLSTNFLIKQKEKSKENSRKGAYYYVLNKEQYKKNCRPFLNFAPNIEIINISNSMFQETLLITFAKFMLAATYRNSRTSSIDPVDELESATNFTTAVPG